MKKLSVTISGHRTSLTLEAEFIDTLRKIAATQNTTVSKIIHDIDSEMQTREAADRPINLSSAVRVWVLQQLLLQSPK